MRRRLAIASITELRAEVRGNTLRLDNVDRRLGDLVQVTGLSVSRQMDLARRVDTLEERVGALERR